MSAKIYLIVVSLLYFVLAMWCSFQPKVTSEKVGFTLNGGSGSSEFLTVYGGLEFGLALILMAAAFRQSSLYEGVVACVLIHASLVVFRSIGFFLYSGIEKMTYQLAVGEWVILLVGVAILFWQKKSG